MSAGQHWVPNIMHLQGTAVPLVPSLCNSARALLHVDTIWQVHYLSLDVEGVEEGVLSSVPWHKIDVK